MNHSDVVSTLAQRFAAQHTQFRGDDRLILDSEHLTALATAMRDEFGYKMLTFITVVDYWPEEEPRFHVVYQFSNVENGATLQVRVPQSGDAPVLPSLTGIFPNANWHERECFDMFGIRFENHPDLRRILMPFDWEGHPLRKDYPLGYEEVQFTFNYDDIQQRKPHPQD